MLRIHAISAGAVEYLIRGCGCAAEHAHSETVEQAQGLGPEYFAAAVSHGEALGRWRGSGLEALGLSARSGDVVDVEDVRALFGQLRRPESTEEDPVFLGRRPPKYRSEQERYTALLAKENGLVSPERERELRMAAATDGRRGIAYYDFTFSAPKSVSVYAAALRAAGAENLAVAVVEAHNRAADIAVDFADQRIAYTRTGWHGRAVTGNESIGRHEAGVGTVWTTWQHSTSRENEPQLHTHGALLNRTVTADGKIGALDGAAFRAWKEAIDTAYTRALEQLVTAATGARFELRPDGVAREIIGVDAELMAEASSRRGQVLARVAELTDAYRERNGREPSAAARKAIADMATLDTRAAKGPESGPEAVAAWSAERVERLVAVVEAVAAAGHDPDSVTARAGQGGHAGQTVGHDMTAEAAVVAGVAAGDRPVTPAMTGAPGPDTGEEMEAVMAAALADVQARYAVWTIGNLTAALDARLGDAHELGVSAEQRPALLEQLTRQALGSAEVVLVSTPDPVAVPQELRRADGGSLYRRANGERYATSRHLAVEDRVVTEARAGLGITLDGPALEMLGVELAAAGLSEDQVAAVAGIVSSGRVGDVLVGPAGAGKSRTVGELARVWAAHTGGRVLGVATSEIATRNLAGDGLEGINSSRFRTAFTPDEHGQVRDRLQPGDMVIIDEAGMSSTKDLAMITGLCSAAGAKVLYTGDPHQLDAVEAGGLFAHLVDTGPAHELREVHRFDAQWEREASLALRAGDQRVVDAYGDRGRLHTGTIEEMQESAARAYVADVAAGKEALLIVGTNDDARHVSGVVRDRLIALGLVEATPVARLGEVGGGAEISVGDRVQALLNNYQLRVDPEIGADGVAGLAEPVANRTVYTVVGRDAVSGELLVRDRHGATAHLPDSYVTESLTLAYAVTVYAAQGVTVDVGHPIVDRDATREQLYPAATRGREANHLWLVTERAPDVHDPERIEESARERLAAVLATSSAQQAAVHVRAQGVASAESLTMAAAQWDAVVGEFARARYTNALESLLGPERAELARGEVGYGRLLRSVREAELAGHNPETLLIEAVTERGLGGAASMSDVLRWRLRRLADSREPEQLVDPSDWTTLSAPMDGAIGEYAQALAVLASDRQQLLGRQVGEQAPEWATAHLGPVPEPDRVEQRADWERRAGIAAAYRELHRISDEEISIGQAPSREYEFHRALWSQARDALGRPAEAINHQSLDDAQLYARTERWAREQAIAPEWVADQLADAYRAAHEHRITGWLRTAELHNLPQHAPERAELAADCQSLARMAQWHTRRAHVLEESYTRRADWAERTADTARDARLAAEELDRRGLPARRGGATEPDTRRIGGDPEHQHNEQERTVANEERSVRQASGIEPPARERALAHERHEAVRRLEVAARRSAERGAYTLGRRSEHTLVAERAAAADMEADRARRDHGLDETIEHKHALQRSRSLGHGLGM